MISCSCGERNQKRPSACQKLDIWGHLRNLWPCQHPVTNTKRGCEFFTPPVAGRGSRVASLDGQTVWSFSIERKLNIHQNLKNGSSFSTNKPATHSPRPATGSFAAPRQRGCCSSRATTPFLLTGSSLSSRTVSSRVLSAYKGLTAVFGMGTGGSP